jgi:2-methylcitrate dehydratase PrpD
MMPSALEVLAAFVQDAALGDQSQARTERLRLHIADTVGMILQGALLAEGRAAVALGSRLATWCACARLTEADDIHLTSCTTPGSVVVPTALHLAECGVFKNWKDFLTSVLTGYEVLIRVGYAIDGPRVLAQKIWPTLFAAPVHVEFLLMRQSAFGITHDNVPARDKVSTPLVWTPGS